MPRNRANSALSLSTVASSAGDRDGGYGGEQELGSMYDYLAKVVLIGPSGCGKSCLLHRFVKDEWRIYTSQTIGVEFASKIVRVGNGSRRKRVKLQLWDTAGTERFRSVSRSYYRAAAAAVLVYDVSSMASFRSLPTFLHDARALGSRQLVTVVAGNKSDLFDQPAQGSQLIDDTMPLSRSNTARPAPLPRLGTTLTATTLQDMEHAEREVAPDTAAAWAESHGIHTAVEVSALSGDGVDELFARIAATILTRIELGEIDPSDPACGIQYGDSRWGDEGDDFANRSRQVNGRGWDSAFRVGGRRRAGCC